tara:strand:- start:51 stop:248 length:198 start_codon:yes stop_codon:yes gene_type:complete
MSWYEVIKVNLAGARMYAGTCPKCKKYVATGEPCPLNLPAESTDETDVRFESCPMKLDDDAVHLE